jgi:hypothetical protein
LARILNRIALHAKKPEDPNHELGKLTTIDENDFGLDLIAGSSPVTTVNKRLINGGEHLANIPLLADGVGRDEK